jgi:serine/threonine-protein kinase
MPDPDLERRAIALFQRLLDVPEAERHGWLEAQASSDEKLRARVNALQSADRLAKLRTGGAAGDLEEELPPERIGAYRLGALIGRGGMGSVYRGERAVGDFDHIAAIKLIKPGLFSDELVKRFQRERQTLASLAHPHIARLYDGGETEGGSPFIVMEHVDGLPLLSWIDERRPDREQRRRLFSDVCGAVAFAHRNLVVHRDITPSNVLVTKDDVAKLIDFGISRPLDRGGDGAVAPSTSLGSLSLTPGYAAPERMTSAEVTTAADIYSLGKLLAKLMAPERDDAELAAIVARATAQRPGDRYLTVEALAADVEAWGGGLPVAAVGGGRSYLARKFVSRHRFGAAAATVGLALLVAALVITLIANRRADTARAEAERRFDQTRAIAKTMMFDAYDEVSKVPGGTSARETLARSGLAYLDALASDREAPPDVRAEVVRGYTRLAQVMGSGQSSQLGRYSDSNALLAKAEEVLAPLWAEHAGRPDVIRARADLLLERSGTNLYNNNKIKLARSQALEVQRLMGPRARADPEAARLYAVAIQAEGDSYGWDDDYTRARDVHRRAEAFIAALPPALRAEDRLQQARSANLRLLAEAHHRIKEEPEAQRAIEGAIAINLRMFRAAPDDPVRIRKLALSLWYGAVLDYANKRDAAAARSIERAMELAERLRSRAPDDAGAVQLVAIVGEIEAQILGSLGRFDESYAAGGRVIDAHRRLVQLSGDAAGARRGMAAVLTTLGGNHYNGGDFAGACTRWREALDTFQLLDRRGSLTEHDRNNGVPELTNFLERSCENGPPRAGVGKKV